jgi:hypothetical protein
MDSERFDGLIRALGEGTTRRGALGVLAGLAGLGLGEVAAKRRGRGRGKGKARVRAQSGNPAKTAICHYDDETGTFHLIEVDDSAVQKHRDNHGDFFPGEVEGCCTDADCGENETCVVDEATNTGSCQGSTCDACDVNEPCNDRKPCGADNSCNCWARADRSGCHCGPFDDCGNHQPCGAGDTCPDGQVCIENCCGKLCYPDCSATAARVAAESVAADGPKGIRDR